MDFGVDMALHHFSTSFYYGLYCLDVHSETLFSYKVIPSPLLSSSSTFLSSHHYSLCFIGRTSLFSSLWSYHGEPQLMETTFHIPVVLCVPWVGAAFTVVSGHFLVRFGVGL